MATLGRRLSRLFHVFPIPLSTPVTALGQVSPLGSPFVSLLVAALQRRNSYVFHVSNSFERYHSFVVPYGRNATDICHLVVIIGVFCKVIFQETRPGHLDHSCFEHRDGPGSFWLSAVFLPAEQVLTLMEPTEPDEFFVIGLDS